MPESESQDASRSPATPADHQKPPHLSSKTLLLEYLLLAALVGLFVWRALVPAWSDVQSDFPNYYLAARLYRQGYALDRVYEWTWFQRQKDHAGLQNRLATYVPVTLPSIVPVLPFCSLPLLAAKRCWVVVDLVLLGLAGIFLNLLTGLGARRIAILTFLAIFPLRGNFLFGQQHILVFFLLTLAAWLYFSKRPASSGAVLALAAALKIYPALFVFYFLRKRQWRALTGLVLGGLGLAALSLWLFGYEANRVYVWEVLPRAMRGETVDPYSASWQSVTALLRRLFIFEPELNPQPLMHWPAAYAYLQPLYQALLFVPALWLISPSRDNGAQEKLEWGSYVVVLLVLSPNPASYHYCALILAVALIGGNLLDRGLKLHVGILAVLYGVASISHYRWMVQNPSGWKIFLGFPRLYAVLVLTFFILLVLATSSSQTLRARLRSREAMAFTCPFLGIILVGVWSNLRHLEGQFTNYAARAVAASASLMAIQPAARGEEILFTAMTRDGFTLRKLEGNAFTQLDFGTDAFHPALAENVPYGWVELASTRSRIVRFPLSGPLPPSNQLPVEVEDAEQPVVSPDGRWLAFVREHQGRGSLWIKNLQPDETTAPSAVERRLAGDEFNVLEAAFSSDSRGVMFSARRDTQPELFSVRVEGNPRVIQATPDSGWPATRDPAFSTDGAWLAFCWYQRGAWQLCVTKVGSGAVRQLTQGDCNSITPAWLPDSRTLIYATDCGRGLGLTALARIQAVP